MWHRKQHRAARLHWYATETRSHSTFAPGALTLRPISMNAVRNGSRPCRVTSPGSWRNTRNLYLRRRKAQSRTPDISNFCDSKEKTDGQDVLGKGCKPEGARGQAHCGDRIRQSRACPCAQSA